MLWQAEKSTDLLTTIAGIQIFTFGSVGGGRDRLGLELMKEGRLMAERLLLFGIPGSESISAHFDNMSPKWKMATAHTAWGFYNWHSQVCSANKSLVVMLIVLGCILSSTMTKPFRILHVVLSQEEQTMTLQLQTGSGLRTFFPRTWDILLQCFASSGRLFRKS